MYYQFIIFNLEIFKQKMEKNCKKINIRENIKYFIIRRSIKILPSGSLPSFNRSSSSSSINISFEEKSLASVELSTVYTMARFVNKSSILSLMKFRTSVMPLLNA